MMKRILSWSHLLVWLLLLGACVPETAEPVTPPATVTPGALRAVGEPTAVSTSTPQTPPNEETPTSPAETSNTAVPSAPPTNTATPVIIEGGSLPTPIATRPPENYPVPPETDTAVGNETNSAGYPVSGATASATEQPFTATGGNSSSGNTAVTPPPTATVDPDAIFADEGPTATTAEEVFRLIFADLRALGIDISEADVEIEEIVAGSWPDSSLGCPEPGMNYLQVITPGYMVTLLVEGETYIYHTDDALNILLCAQTDRTEITPVRPENR